MTSYGKVRSAWTSQLYPNGPYNFVQSGTSQHAITTTTTTIPYPIQYQYGQRRSSATDGAAGVPLDVKPFMLCCLYGIISIGLVKIVRLQYKLDPDKKRHNLGSFLLFVPPHFSSNSWVSHWSSQIRYFLKNRIGPLLVPPHQPAN